MLKRCGGITNEIFKLELKKQAFRVFMGFFVDFTAVLGHGDCIFPLIPILDTLDGTPDAGPELWMFSTWRGLSILISQHIGGLLLNPCGRDCRPGDCGRLFWQSGCLCCFPIRSAGKGFWGAKVCLTAGFTVAAAFVCIVAATLILAGLSRISGWSPRHLTAGFWDMF